MKSRNKMKLAGSFIMVLAGLCASTPYAQALPVKEGVPAPAFSVKTLAGKPLNLAGLKGKVVLLDFGAVECPPCRIEMPALEALHKKYSRRDLVVVGLLEMNPTRAAAKSMLKQRGITFPVAIDARELIGKRYGLEAHPTTVLIDRAGKIIKVETGYLKGDEKAMEQAFLPLLSPLSRSIKTTGKESDSNRTRSDANITRGAG